MPLFRRKPDKLPKTSSLSLYGQGRSQMPQNLGEKSMDKSSNRQFSPDERHQPFLAFAEVTFDPSLSMRQKSRLSKTLQEVLHDNAALAYFIQFMDSIKAHHIIKFWLEAESFRVSVCTRLRDFPEGHELKSSDPSCPLVSSDSSGCVSEHSDDLFHSSSQYKCCDSNNVNETKIRCVSSDTGIDGMSVSISQMNSHNSCSSITSHSDSSSETSQVITSVNEETTCEKGCEKGMRSDTNYVNRHLSHTLHNNADLSTTSLSSSTHNTDGLPNCVSSDISVNTDCGLEWGVDAETLNLTEQDCSKTSMVVRLKTSIEQDAQSIYEKYISRTAPCSIEISEELQEQIGVHIFQKEGKIDSKCFLSAQTFMVQRMEVEYFPHYLRSSFHCKYQIDVLTSGNIYLADVIYNDSALFYFMEFMEQENVRHLLDFLLMADNFQKHLLGQENYDGNQAQSDAMVIYDKYFSLQASNSLGFSDSIRYEVEHLICREGGPLPDCFQKPVHILMQYLEKTYLLQFLNSQLYFKYISECIITIQSGGANWHMQAKVSGSESGSEHSLPISSVNTLLAMDEKQPGANSKVLKNIEDQNMRIDTDRFKPDSLWQRPLAGRLQMTHIDKLGRVVTEFEPEPDRRRESRISKAMKKLVSRDDDKNQEDMAWQVAEMIVKDICSITMPNSFDNVTENRPS